MNIAAAPTPPSAPPRASGLPHSPATLAARRLGVTGLIYAVAYVLDYGVNLLAAPAEAGSLVDFPMTHVAAAVFVPLALGVYLALRSWTPTEAQLGWLAIGFQLAGALGIALEENWRPWPADQGLRGVSWVCVWITIYPVLVPTTLARAFAGALLAAAAVPLSIGLSMAVHGSPLPELPVLVDLLQPPFMIALLAPLAARVVYRLSATVHRLRRLGGYELEARLGQGGMGEVWRARHHMLIRPAAVKIIRPDVLGEGERAAVALARFRREALATASLVSPHTVALYDFGPTEDGGLYYVMELLEGLDLEALVRRHGPLPPERAIYLLRQVCHSLAEAHDQGLVHRDVKPSNVCVGPRGLDHDFVKVLDFGLVKAPVLTGADDVAATARGEVSGTPAFMAPECASAPDAVDARADVYSLGCLAFWLLTGRLVFEASTALEMILAHVGREAPAPSQLTELALPAELDELVLACLSKEPVARPPTVAAVAEALASVPLEGPWTSARAERWWAAIDPETAPAGGPGGRVESPVLR